MKKILLLGFVMICLYTDAQSIVSDKVDKFDSTRIVTTSNACLNKYMGIDFCYAIGKVYWSKEGEKRYWLFIAFRPEMVTSLNKESICSLLFSDQSKLELKNCLTKSSTYITSEYAVFLTCVTDDELKKIATSKLSDLRISTSKYNHDVSIKPRFDNSLSNIANLLLKY